MGLDFFPPFFSSFSPALGENRAAASALGSAISSATLVSRDWSRAHIASYTLVSRGQARQPLIDFRKLQLL